MKHPAWAWGTKLENCYGLPPGEAWRADGDWSPMGLLYLRFPPKQIPTEERMYQSHPTNKSPNLAEPSADCSPNPAVSKLGEKKNSISEHDIGESFHLSWVSTPFRDCWKHRAQCYQHPTHRAVWACPRLKRHSDELGLVFQMWSR